MRRPRKLAVLLLFFPICLVGQDQSPRVFADLQDDQPGYQVHFIYAVPAGGGDRAFDRNGDIERSVQSLQQWLSGQTGGRTLRVDSAGGRVDVTFLRLRETNAEMLRLGPSIADSIEGELVASGFDNPYKFYAVYFDGESGFSCGEAPWPPDRVGSLAVVYLKGQPFGGEPCAAKGFTTDVASPGVLEFGMLHEILHGFGIVPRCAPNQALSGHLAGDPEDLMFIGGASWKPAHLDRNHTDYFSHNRSGCPDLGRSVFLSGSPDPGDTPPAWPIQSAEEHDCSLESTLLSPASTVPATLHVINATGRRQNLYWIDPTGHRAPTRTLNPWQTVRQSTFEGHNWLLAETNGTCSRIYEAAAGYRRALAVNPTAIGNNSVVEAFSFQPGLAPSTWVTLFGAELAANTAVWDPQPNDPLPVELAGISVYVHGRPAPLSFVSPGQVNLLVPSDAPVGEVQIEVRRGERRITTTAVVAPVLPALYALPARSATGFNYWITAIVESPDGPIMVGNPRIDGRAARGAKVGELLQIYALGLGETDPGVSMEWAYSGAAPLRNPIKVYFGTEEGEVQFAGLVGTGLYQINVTIPSAVGAGDVRVTVETQGIRSRSDVFLLVE